jgi:hypothetical protein
MSMQILGPQLPFSLPLNSRGGVAVTSTAHHHFLLFHPRWGSTDVDLRCIWNTTTRYYEISEDISYYHIASGSI